MKEINGFVLFPYNIVFFLLLSCAPHPLSCTPPSPPSTDPLNLPVSSDSVTENPPFFPAYPLPPPPPPPPPPPATLTTYPADISALVVPHSPDTKPKSGKLLIPAVCGVISVATAACIVFFLCRRRQGRHGRFRDGSKNLTSDDCSLEYTSPNSKIRNTNRKLAVNPSSSEVLYLGNVVNSHSLDDDPSHPRNDSGSPELRPLPPLSNHQSFEQNHVVVSVTEEEEEEEKEEYEDDDEFYSPTISLAGTEISSRVRSSGSGQISVVQIPVTKNSVSSTCSCSTFSSNSHGKSVSITISPDASSSPQRSETRNWNLPFVQNPRSPSLSVASTSPDKDLINHRSESLRVFGFLNRQIGFPRISTASTSPERGFVKTPDAYARSSFYSSASTSPDGVFEKTLRASPAKLNDFGRNVQSVLLSSSSISPIRESCDDPDNNPAAFNHFGQNLHSRSHSGSNKTISAPPRYPPPPPPPPLPCQLNTGATITEPPPLTRPSLPFVGRNPRKWRSLSELPVISSETPERPKPKIKPLHWDKFRTISSRKNAWDRLRSSSFKLNEEMIETLFVDSKPKQTAAGFDHPELTQDCRILDSRQSQNIGILLKSLNVSTEDVCEALANGDVAGLGTELLESLSKIHLCEEEIQQLKGHKDDAVIRLSAAEKFLKSVMDVPLAFKRVDALLYVANFDSEVKTLKESFEILQAACDELKTSRMLLKLLEAVLKTGDRMNLGLNRSDADEFKLDTLLRFVDVKGIDGKTSLLHFVVLEIIRLESAHFYDTTRVSHSKEDDEIGKHWLRVISNLSSELSSVKKSAAMDFNTLHSNVHKLVEGAAKIKEVLSQGENMEPDEKMWKKFSESMTGFLNAADVELRKVHDQESSVLSAVKEITEYFHGDLAKEEANPIRIFVVVRNFLRVLDRVSKEISVLSSACKFPFD